MKIQEYTCRAVAWDKAVIQEISAAYFQNRRTFLQCLASWDGRSGPGPNKEAYRYFETKNQKQQNENVWLNRFKTTSLPIFYETFQY